jgi:hypothetical protein
MYRYHIIDTGELLLPVFYVATPVVQNSTGTALGTSTLDSIIHNLNPAHTLAFGY